MVRALVDCARTGAGALVALGVVSACGAAQTAPPAPAPTRAPTASAPAAPASSAEPGTLSWLVADTVRRTVTVALQVTPATTAGGPALINGQHNGGVQIIVPLNWTVQWDWRNADSTAPHSLVVMAEREKLPLEGGREAFTNAMTRAVTAGLAAGQGDRTTFTAEEAGWYWLLCGVPGHAIAGEYLGLRVDPEAKTASVKAK
jgi:sulfocyanin SoxE-like protein